MKKYIQFKCSIGYSERSYRVRMKQFDRFCARRFPDADHVSEEIVLEWSRLWDGESENNRINRMIALKGLLDYLDASGIRIHTIPRGWIGSPGQVCRTCIAMKNWNAFSGCGHTSAIQAFKATGVDCAYYIPDAFLLRAAAPGNSGSPPQGCGSADWEPVHSGFQSTQRPACSYVSGPLRALPEI